MKRIVLLFVTIFYVSVSFGQNGLENDAIDPYDIKVPDPLITFSGEKINSKEEWIKKRRPEILSFFAENVYGKVPCDLKAVNTEILEQSNNALNGKAKRKQVKLTFQKNDKTLTFTVLIYLPVNIQNSPVFLGYNFYGNHTVKNEKEIIISDAWTRNNESMGIYNNKFNEQSRGKRISRWPVEKLLKAGFGVVTVYRGEVDPDKDDYSDGIQALCYHENQVQPEKDEWGSIAAWSWGLSRVMDFFETENEIDETKVVVFGHSRLGKAALWAGATDQRFAAVISNNSGCGGAALSKRKFGETVSRINKTYPNWFCENFRNYNDNEDALPVDQHELIALIAPRPVYIASAEDDRWSDPRGEFLSAWFAGPVYELFGEKGIPSDVMPPVNQPIQNTVAYHIRTGEHDIKEYDWEQYIIWAKEQLTAK